MGGRAQPVNSKWPSGWEASIPFADAGYAHAISCALAILLLMSLIVTTWCVVACVGMHSPYRPTGTLTPTAVSSATLPEDHSFARLLWPGAFEQRLAATRFESIFVASGMRYLAQARSNGLQVRRGGSRDPAINVRFVGVARRIAAQPSEPARATFTLFSGVAGHERAKQWRRHAVTTFPQVYPGIDARFSANAGDIELDFLLAPGADPRRIKLSAEHGTLFGLEARTGDILVARGDERFRMRRPRAFQPAGSGRVEVEVRAITDSHMLRFDLPLFDRSLPLIIDPLVATWSTFLGTRTDAFCDDATSVATDSAGNIYVAGLTQFDTVILPSDSFPTTPGSLQVPNLRSPGNNCAYQCGYVLKLSPSHQVLYGALIYGLTINQSDAHAGLRLLTVPIAPPTRIALQRFRP